MNGYFTEQKDVSGTKRVYEEINGSTIQFLMNLITLLAQDDELGELLNVSILNTENDSEKLVLFTCHNPKYEKKFYIHQNDNPLDLESLDDEFELIFIDGSDWQGVLFADEKEDLFK